MTEGPDQITFLPKEIMKWGARRGSTSRSCANGLLGTGRPCAIEPLEPRCLFSSVFGSIDQSFGVIGHAYAPITAAGNSPDDSPGTGSLVIAANGDIYATGSAGIAKFSSAGVRDQSYGTDGLASVPSGNIVGQAADSNGLLYFLTASSTGTDLVRYSADGVADGAYGDAGVMQVSSDTSLEPAALAVQPDNKIVIAYLQDSLNLFVQRFDANGSLDTTFANSGDLQIQNFLNLPIQQSVNVGYAGYAQINGCSVMANSDIVIGGGSIVDYDPGPAFSGQDFVLRLTPAGALDPTYGTDGISGRYQFRGVPNDGDVDPEVENLLLDTLFAANSSGIVTITRPYSEQAGEGIDYFNTLGASSFSDPADDGAGSPIGVAVLPDGQAVLLQGNWLTIANFDGTVAQSATVASFDPEEVDEVSPRQSIAMAPDGDLIALGAPASGSGAELTAISLGSESAPTPEAIPNATVNAISSAPNGSLDLAYHNSASNDLQFVAGVPDGQWGTPITVDPTAGAGDAIAIDTNPANPSLIDIAYYDHGTKSLKLATSTDAGKTFSTHTIDAAGDVGESPSIYVNHLGLASIAFYNQTTQHLQFAAQKPGGRWKISTIDASGNVGADAVLVPSPSGQLTIAYSDKTRGWLKLAERNNNGKWQIAKAAVAPEGAEGISMAYGIADSAAIAFYDISRHELRVTQLTDSTGLSFSTTTVAPNLGELTEIFAGSSLSATTTIYAYDAAGDNIQKFGVSSNEPAEYYPEGAVVADGGNYFSQTDADGIDVAAYLDNSTGELAVGPIA
jgi:hypothetical protein